MMQLVEEETKAETAASSPVNAASAAATGAAEKASAIPHQPPPRAHSLSQQHSPPPPSSPRVHKRARLIRSEDQPESVAMNGDGAEAAVAANDTSSLSHSEGKREEANTLSPPTAVCSSDSSPEASMGAAAAGASSSRAPASSDLSHLVSAHATLSFRVVSGSKLREATQRGFPLSSAFLGSRSFICFSCASVSFARFRIDRLSPARSTLQSTASSSSRRQRRPANALPFCVMVAHVSCCLESIEIKRRELWSDDGERCWTSPMRSFKRI